MGRDSLSYETQAQKYKVKAQSAYHYGHNNKGDTFWAMYKNCLARADAVREKSA